MILVAAKGYMGLNLSTEQKKNNKRLTPEIKIQPIAILTLAILSALTNSKSWVVSANGLLVQKKLHPEENM